MHLGADTIVCTEEHPFFENDGWVAAKDLKQGDSLFAFSGAKLKIDSLYQFRADTATVVYNLEASWNHNYYVSSSCILVHNKAANAKDLAALSKLYKKLNLKSINSYLFKTGYEDVIDLSVFKNNKYGKWVLEKDFGGHGTVLKLKNENIKGYWSLTNEGKILRWKR